MENRLSVIPINSSARLGLAHEAILTFLESERGAEIEARFWVKVAVGEARDCWDWTAGVNAKGYGRFKIASREVRHANRVAWTIANRREPGKLIVRHSCDRPVCCNPRHLLIGTTLDNTRDMIERGRARLPDQRGANNNATCLTLADVGEIVEAFRRREDNVDIAARYPVGHSMISRIRTGRSWQTEAARFGWGPAIAALGQEDAA
ncbi:HNH endonuclease [Sphingomonas sp. FUKUSWIS1]|uniref:HNH endonuclease n=1 Tax=Sphingomonas sp. FUKUSWIS1 TaxID=1379701 RepID=UPI00069423AD|nr:HNH endonuclease [Sphingomonas sp. FUKUSWIS1]